MIPNIFAAAGLVSGAMKAGPELQRLKKATSDFETAFVKQLVTEMRKATKSEFEGVPGSGIYEDMTNQVLAERLSAKGGFGIGAAMYKELSKLVLSQAGQARIETKL